jgi:hypothetical protein
MENKKKGLYQTHGVTRLFIFMSHSHVQSKQAKGINVFHKESSSYGAEWTKERA